MPEFVDLEEALDKGQRDPESESGFREGYMLFVDQFVRATIGCALFDGYATKRHVSEFVGVSDEALALLLWENQEDRWKEMAERGVAKSQLPGKYTDGGQCRRSTGRSRKGKGWSCKGINRFNKLCEKIEADRKTKDRKDMERYFLLDKQKTDVASNSKKKKKCNELVYSDDKEEQVDSVYVEHVNLVEI